MSKDKKRFQPLSDAADMLKAAFGRPKDSGRNAQQKVVPTGQKPEENPFEDIERALLRKASDSPGNLSGSHIPSDGNRHVSPKAKPIEPSKKGPVAEVEYDPFRKGTAPLEKQPKRCTAKGSKQAPGKKKNKAPAATNKNRVVKLPGMKGVYRTILEDEQKKAAEAISSATKPRADADADRRKVIDRIRQLVGSRSLSIERRPVSVSLATADSIDKAIEVGARAFAAAPDPDLDNGFIVGFDFGTSSLKLAVRQPYRAGTNIAFLPVPTELRSGDHSHLWQTALWFDPVSQVFSLFPKPGMEVLEGFKTGIIGGHGGERVRSDLPVTRSEAAIAYLAMQIAHFLGWYSIAKPLAAGGDRFLSINIGIPVAAHDDIKAFQTFRHIICAAQSLVAYAEKLSLKSVREAHQISGANCPDGWQIIPELTAAIAGYAADPTSQSGAHVLIDVGASTLDIVAFNHLRQERVAVISAGVELLGSSALQTALDDGVTEDDCRWACDQQFQSVFGEACRPSRGSNGFSPQNRSRDVQLIVTGGGCASELHSAFISSKNCPAALGTLPIVRPEPPALGTLGACDASRLLLAYGLTRDVNELLELKLPSQVPDIKPRRGPTNPFTSKDDV